MARARRFLTSTCAGPGVGFTLLELVLVMGLTVGLTVLALAGYSSISQATALSAGAAALADAFDEGRQDAVTKNLTVEVRFYEVPGGGGVAPACRAVQLHWLEGNGATPGVNAPLFLPASVVIDTTATHSSLLSSANTETATPDASDRLLNGETRVFHFLPDGSTDLDPAKSWFFTLRAATASDPNHFPADWACLSVDPATGRVQIYRP